VRAVPRLCEFYPGICLPTEGKARKNLSQGKKNLSQGKKNLGQVKKILRHSTAYILPKHPHITLWSKLYHISETLSERQYVIHNLKLNFSKTTLLSAAEFHGYVFDSLHLQYYRQTTCQFLNSLLIFSEFECLQIA
jgi:cytoplasmic iron level regulating protein YaaA (DUF328/UPF0246 family)